MTTIYSYKIGHSIYTNQLFLIATTFSKDPHIYLNFYLNFYLVGCLPLALSPSHLSHVYASTLASSLTKPTEQVNTSLYNT